MTVGPYMSDVAKALMAEMAGADAPVATPETIEVRRAEARAAFLPRAERAVAQYGVRVETVEIGGQACLDIRRAGDARGTVLYCYGGGYISGSAQEDLIVSAALAALAGTRVVSVEYPLAPEHPWPAAHDAAWAVYEALLAEDPKLALAGESAGGNLALTLMLRAPFAPSAVLLLSPWCDLSHGGDAMEVNDGRDPTLRYADSVAASAMYVGEADRTRPEISPIHGAFSDAGPPVMITTGTRDLLFSQCAELARRMRAAGQEVRLDVHDGLWHVFEFYDELPEARASLEACAAFLKGHLRGKAATNRRPR